MHIQREKKPNAGKLEQKLRKAQKTRHQYILTTKKEQTLPLCNLNLKLKQLAALLLSHVRGNSDPQCLSGKIE